ncbi:gephyrin-like molybdotransferase Glp [Dokdonella sp.]|uniref:molybdopterin molybdotransferase MoeA n=1 Tax=Dokdonella sp. TaxID=2291710 RepID=UPI0035299628
MASNPDIRPISLDQAQQKILSVCADRRSPSERVGLERAQGRILATDLETPRDLPPFDNSAMDGFALNSADLPANGEARLRIAGIRFAGDAETASIGPGACLRITTGAPLPVGADTVIIKERVRVDGEEAIIPAGELAGSNVRRAGEDFAAGDVVMRKGQRITSTRIGGLASLGQDTLDVACQPRVSVVTTGSELVMPGMQSRPGTIYNSNGYSLAALLRASGLEPKAPENGGQGPSFLHLPDDREKIGSALRDLAGRSEVIITSGGASAGEADWLPTLVGELGVIHFWKVRMRPGMPFLFGEIGSCLIFCLPGNPVSTIATFLCLVQPALQALQGAECPMPELPHARLTRAVTKRHERAEFLRARCEVRNDGTLWVDPLTRQGSAMQRGIIEANALILVPEAVHTLEAGALVRIMRLPEQA